MEASEAVGGNNSSDRLTDRICIGVLADVIPSDLVEEVLAETGALQQRTRLLPA